MISDDNLCPLTTQKTKQTEKKQNFHPVFNQNSYKDWNKPEEKKLLEVNKSSGKKVISRSRPTIPEKRRFAGSGH